MLYKQIRNFLGVVGLTVSLVPLVATQAAATPSITAHPTSCNPSSTIQAAIDCVALAGGGSVTLGAGTFTLSSTLTIAPGQDNVHLIGTGPGGTILSYAGSTDAIKVGDSSGAFTSRITIENLTIDLGPGRGNFSCTSSSSVGLHLVSTETVLLNNIEVKSPSCSTAGQTAISLDGTGVFGAFTTIIHPRIVGSFTTGILATGISGQTANANAIIGGALINTGCAVVQNGVCTQLISGTTGIDVVLGDSTSAFNTDVENWDVGVSASSPYTGPLSVRLENNNTPWSSSSTFVVGAHFGACDLFISPGTPEGVVPGHICDLDLNTSGSTATLYVKQSNAIGGDITKGWQAK